METNNQYGDYIIRKVVGDKKIVKDGRLELYKVKSSLKNDKVALDFLDKIEQNAKAVLMVVDKSAILENANSKNVIIESFPLWMRPLPDDQNICSHSTYARQRSSKCRGTGFFVKSVTESQSPQWIVGSAAHVLVSGPQDIRNLRFIAGVIIQNAGNFKYNITIHKSQVFKPVPDYIDNQLPYSDYEYFIRGAEWGLMKVERAYPEFTTYSPNCVQISDNLFDPSKGYNITNRENERNRVIGPAWADDFNVYSIGHGLGLPMNLSYDGTVIQNIINDNFFECTLSLLGGCSGSPVFSSKTHELVGIYMRGVNKLEFPNKTNKECMIVRRSISLLEGQECARVHLGTHFRNRLQKRMLIF